jgi:hypothetical protein
MALRLYLQYRSMQVPYQRPVPLRVMGCQTAANPKAGGCRTALGDDAPMLAGEFGIDRDRSRRREVEIALERKPQRTAGGGELVETHVDEFRLPEAEATETEGEMLPNRVQFGEEPCGVAVGGEQFRDGFEVDGGCLLVDGGALNTFHCIINFVPGNR